MELEHINKDTLWYSAICKEMKKNRITFEVFDGNAKDIPPGYQHVDCHMIFDIKMGETLEERLEW